MLNLSKDTPAPLTATRLGIGAAWKTSGGGRKGLGGLIRRHVGADLDLAAVALAGGAPKRMCWFDNRDAFDDGSLTIDGDSRTGRGPGDDEFIRVDLTTIPQEIDTIVFLVSAYKEGVTFDNVEGITLSVYDMDNGQQRIGGYMPDIDSRGNAAVILRAVRTPGGGWGMTLINQLGNARTRAQLLDLARTHA